MLRECVIVWFPHGFDRCVMSCLSAVSPKWSELGINIVSSVFSLADRTLGKATLDSGKLDLGLQWATKVVETLFKKWRFSTLEHLSYLLHSEIWVLLMSKSWQAYSSLQKFKENITFFGSVILRDIRAWHRQFRVSAGAHYLERATSLFSCNGVFTSRVIFRYAFPARNTVSGYVLYRSLSKNDGCETPLYLLVYFVFDVFELSFSIIP